jgi:hypothetical protein
MKFPRSFQRYHLMAYDTESDQAVLMAGQGNHSWAAVYPPGAH